MCGLLKTNKITYVHAI